MEKPTDTSSELNPWEVNQKIINTQSARIGSLIAGLVISVLTCFILGIGFYHKACTVDVLYMKVMHMDSVIKYQEKEKLLISNAINQPNTK